MKNKKILLSIDDGRQKVIVTNQKKIKFWTKLIDNGSLPRNTYKEIK